MQVAPVNNRHCGWRESAKIVPEVKTATSNIAELTGRLDIARKVYDRDVPALLGDLSSGINTLQSARVLIEYIKKLFRES